VAPEDLTTDVDAFVLAATSGRCDRARRLLATRPDIAGDPWAALVLGRAWTGDALEPGGPRGWAPLLYVAHSCFASVELARGLLARGADPNASFTNEYGAMSAVYGAAGVRHDPGLTRLLLEAGADPNDGEWLYHATEAPETPCLAVLLEHGARPEGTAALAHAIDDDRSSTCACSSVLAPTPTRPAGRCSSTPCGVGAGRRWSASSRSTARGSTAAAASGPRLPSSTARPTRTRSCAAATTSSTCSQRSGRTPTSPQRTSPAPRSRVTSSRPRRCRRRPTPTPRRRSSSRRCAGAWTRSSTPSFFGHVGGGPPGTLLHHASWVGSADVVGRLLARGADPVARSGADYDTPLAWAALGYQNHALPGRDYVAVAELLLAAGARLEPRFTEVAEGPLAGWLQEGA
jgi:hypothetical protein